MKRRARNAYVTDAEREMLIEFNIKQAKEFAGVRELATYYIERARELISERAPDFQKRLDKGLV